MLFCHESLDHATGVSYRPRRLRYASNACSTNPLSEQRASQDQSRYSAISPREGSSVPTVLGNRLASACISDPVMENGRDEMNLAEFPLAGLANRSPKGKGTLVFEDSTWDKSKRGVKLWKRLTVTASAEFGLPTAFDDEVILGLVQLSKAGNFTDRTVTFIPAELFRLLGWREEGRSYSRLETSLKRWIGVTLYYDHAWWDKQRKSWVDEHFHLLERVTVRRRRARGASPRRQPWSITWNEIVFRSFQVGYIKKLDMNIYRQLKSAAAKRVYRFLDKRFHFSNRLSFDLRTFACEHIGFRREDDNSQLKRRLGRAIEELVRVGFLEPLPKANRYRRIRHGCWEVLFVRKSVAARKQSRKMGGDPREAALVKRGIRSTVAARLVREHSEAVLGEAVRKFDRMKERGQTALLDNPPGLLVTLIREGIRGRNTEEVRDSGSTRNATSAAGSPVRLDTERKTRMHREREAVRTYLDTLSPDEFASLETEALSNADPIHAEGYRRDSMNGNLALLREYRDMIIEGYVRGAMPKLIEG